MLIEIKGATLLAIQDFLKSKSTIASIEGFFCLNLNEGLDKNNFEFIATLTYESIQDSFIVKIKNKNLEATVVDSSSEEIKEILMPAFLELRESILREIKKKTISKK